MLHPMHTHTLPYIIEESSPALDQGPPVGQQRLAVRTRQKRLWHADIRLQRVRRSTRTSRLLDLMGKLGLEACGEAGDKQNNLCGGTESSAKSDTKQRLPSSRNREKVG